jgi:magnesium transporter
MAKRRNVSSLLRTLRGQRDVAQALSRANHGVISAKLQPYLRDVYDHCLRVYELLEGAREGIAMSRDAFLSAQSNRMNQTMRVLTVIATVMMPLGVIAGIFGMNFDASPGLHSPAGFWVTMAGMVVGALAMVVWFRRRDWV